MMTETALLDTGEEVLQRVAHSLGIVADLSRADAVLYKLEGNRGRIIAHAPPHSVPAYWRESILDSIWPLEAGGPGTRALQGQRPARTMQKLAQGNLVRVIYPVFSPGHAPIGLLAFDRPLIQEERQRHRKPAFRQAITTLQQMAAQGLLEGAARLSPFSEYDGILVVNRAQEIQYASGVATSILNRAGFRVQLEGLELAQLPTKDAPLAVRAMTECRCLEEVEERPEGSYWIKKAIPLIGTRPPQRTWRRLVSLEASVPHVVGAVLTVHDQTEERRRARELKLKTDMLLELQHRVRNSLQTLTSLISIQARRAESAETRAALQEAINRIHHVAAVHEFLFDPNERRVNLRALTERLVELSRQLVPPPLVVQFHVEGGDVFIAGERATHAALVISELILNAIEHAFGEQTHGNVWIRLAQRGDQVEVEVRDDGQGAPQGFAPDTGLQLVRNLTTGGLQGQFSITNDAAGGAVARVTFTAQSSRRNGAG